MTTVLVDIMISKKVDVPLAIALMLGITVMRKQANVFVLPTPLEINVRNVHQTTGDTALSLDASLVTAVFQDRSVHNVIQTQVAVSVDQISLGTNVPAAEWDT